MGLAKFGENEVIRYKCPECGASNAEVMEGQDYDNSADMMYEFICEGCGESIDMVVATKGAEVGKEKRVTKIKKRESRPVDPESDSEKNKDKRKKT